MPATDSTSQVEQLAQWLSKSQFVCAMTGAGFSAESGVETFRGPKGLWSGRNPMDVATPEAFARDPRDVWRFYIARLRQVAGVRPNPGHLAMARLESLVPGIGLITQNVDRLHQRAGSKEVIELHGNLHEARCTACPYVGDLGDGPLSDEPKCPQCGQWLRPCVVWFGETLPPDAVQKAKQMAAQCDVFLSIGTSSQVYPASQMAIDAHAKGARVVEINPGWTPLTAHAHLAVRAKSGQFLPRVVERLAQLREP